MTIHRAGPFDYLWFVTNGCLSARVWALSAGGGALLSGDAFSQHASKQRANRYAIIKCRFTSAARLLPSIQEAEAYSVSAAV